MNMFVNFGQSADIARLKQAAREMDRHPKGSDRYISAVFEYNQAFTHLHNQGMRCADILRLVGVDTNDYSANNEGRGGRKW